MDITLILLAVYFFLFLFCLYALSHDDFVFMKKNVSLEQLFNVAFLTGICSLFSARLFYVISDFSPAFFNPLVFLVIPYFPGLSLSGAIVGGVLFLFFYTKYRKLPVPRVFDFFALSCFAAVGVGFVTDVLLDFFLRNSFNAFNGILAFLFLGLFLFFMIVLLPRLRNSDLAEGTITLLFLFSFSVFAFLMKLNLMPKRLESFLSIDMILLVVLFLLSFIILIKQEKLLPKFKRLGR